MPLKLLPLELGDFDIITENVNEHEVGDDLIAPPASPLCWPVQNKAEAEARTIWTMKKQKERYVSDATVRYLKVVEYVDSQPGPGNGDIISMGRWHWYPNGYHFEREFEQDIEEIAPPKTGWPSGYKALLHLQIVREVCLHRVKWTEPGRPCWILVNMITRKSRRGLGAGGMIVKWGAQQAKRDNANAFIEGEVSAVPFYEKSGFKNADELQRISLRSEGVDLSFEYVPLKSD